MSVILTTSLLVAGGVILGRVIAKVVTKKKQPPVEIAQAPAVFRETNAKKPASETSFAGFPCALGDVVLRMAGGEAWLAGALVFSEDVAVAALFVAPDAGHDRAVFARPNPAPSLAWLTPLPAGAVPIGSEPPTSIEHEGVRFERARRLPVRVTRAGTGAPDVGDRAILAEYATPAGERLIVVAAGAQSRAWRGATLEPGTFDLLPGAKTL